MSGAYSKPMPWSGGGSTKPPVANNYLDSHGLNPGLGTGDGAVDALGREQDRAAKLLRLAQSSQVFLQRGEVGERRELIERRDGVRGGHGAAL